MKNKIFIAIISFVGTFLILFGLSYAIGSKSEESPASDPVPPETPQNEALPEPPPPPITTGIFGGDAMLSRYVERVTEQSGDYTLPFVNIADEFAEADFAYVNLEAPFAAAPPYGAADYTMVFRVAPEMIQGLKLADISVVSLPGNHAYDAGVEGIEFSEQHLVDNGIGYCFDKPYILEVNGLNFAFLCYGYTLNMDTDQLIQDIDAAKKEGADVIIVSQHDGTEYTEDITDSQSGFAHTAIDHGADLVIGTHPHVVQRMEEYNGKYIFYSLGNLVFDQDWSRETTLGAVVKVTWEGTEIKKMEFKPVKIEKIFQPRWMEPEEGREVLDRLRVDDYEITKQ